VNLEIDPKIGKSKFSINNIPGVKNSLKFFINFSKLKDMISDLILKKFQKMTYPNRKQLKIPMTGPKKSAN